MASTLHVGGQMASGLKIPVTCPTMGRPSELCCLVLMARGRLVGQHIFGTAAIDFASLTVPHLWLASSRLFLGARGPGLDRPGRARTNAGHLSALWDGGPAATRSKCRHAARSKRVRRLLHQPNSWPATTLRRAAACPNRIERPSCKPTRPRGQQNRQRPAGRLG